jgi:TrmH family RNA methyltransferase
LITSPHNEKLKQIRRLNARRRDREREGRFVAEGEDLLAAADARGWEPVERLAAEGSGLPGIPVPSELLASASELGSGTRTLAVYAERWAERPLGPLAVYLHGVGDPGNVGTILRSAEAFSAACVVLGPGSADPYGPKAVRASMGSIFAVTLVRATPDALPGTTVALDAEAETALADLHLGGEVSLLIGAERSGLPADVLSAADLTARIPIATNSLNAAMAATVALYELRRMAR